MARGLHDPDCQCDYASEVQVIVDYIEQQNAKLERAVEALDRLVALNDDYSPFAGEFFHDRVERTWQTARTTLAELKGQNDD
jgi:hypothetical protein